jgi:nitroreductase
MSSTDTDALVAAAEAALRAPSIFNSQPWRWRVSAAGLELSADADRQLPVVDPEHMMSTLSCGIALHHARTALNAEGRSHLVQRLPDPARPDLLARLRITGRHSPDPADVRRYQASLIRHTERRPFEGERVSEQAFDRLRAAAEAEHAYLYRMRPDDVPALAAAVSRAQAIEMADPDYRAELARWTNRPAGRGDGVPADTVPPATPRTVPVREFSTAGPDPDTDTDTDTDTDRAIAPLAEAGTDQAATFAVLSGDGDAPIDWLRAGEAMSAVWLTAVSEGLSVSPISDVAEVPSTRALLRGVLAGIGYPFLALRVGLAEPGSAAPRAPRRDPTEAITLDL